MKTQQIIPQNSMPGMVRPVNAKITRRKAKAYRLPEYLDEVYNGEFPELEIDYSRLRLTSGFLAEPRYVTMESLAYKELTFRWQPEWRRQANPNDTLIVIVLCESGTYLWECFHTDVKRSASKCTVTLQPGFTGRPLHVWLTYLCANKRSFSDSKYMGEIVVPKLSKS